MRKVNNYFYSILWTGYVIGLWFLFQFGKLLPLKLIQYVSQALPTSWQQAIIEVLSSDFGRFGRRLSQFLWLFFIYIISLLILRIPFEKTPLAIKQNSGRCFFQGAFIGASLVIATIVITLAAGAVKITGIIFDPLIILQTVLLYFIAMMLTATTEEFLFRGILLDKLAEAWNRTIALLITSLLFGWLHWHAGGLYALEAVIVGLYLGLGYFQYGLYWCIGWHFAWNCIESIFFSGKIFQFEVVNSWLAGERFITPDRQGFISLPMILLGLGIFLLSKGRTKES